MSQGLAGNQDGESASGPGLLVRDLPAAALLIDSVGKVLDANQPAASLLGCEIASLPGKMLQQFLADGQESSLLACFAGAKDQGQASHAELQLRTGSLFPTSVSMQCQRFDASVGKDGQAGNDARFCALLADITWRKRQQREQAMVPAILDFASDAIITTSPEGIIVSWNDGAHQLFGFSAAEAVGRKLDFFCPPWFSEKEAERLALVREGRMVGPLETFRYSQQGEELHVRAVYLPTFVEGRRLPQLTVIMKASGDHNYKRRKGDDSGKEGAMLATFTSGVAHEFNNLLGGINGYLELLLRQEPLSQPGQRRVEHALSAGYRAAEIIDHLLLLSGKRPMPEAEILPLPEIAMRALRLVQRKYQAEGVTWNIQFPAEGPYARVDSTFFSRAVLKLLINARDSLLDRPEQVISVAAGVAEGKAYLRVADTGCGISQEHAAMLFTPFFTTKGEHAAPGSPQMRVKGMGLGLGVAQTIVREYGGEIKVKSKLGEGSEFIIWLPLAAAPDRLEPQPLLREDGEAARPRVLILDDEEIIRDVFQLYGERVGSLDIISTDDGNVALNLMNCDNPVEVAFIDLKMPKMTGMEFLRLARKLPLDKRPICIIISGYLDDCRLEELLELNVFDVAVKPFSISLIAELLEAALKERGIDFKAKVK